MTVGNAVSQIVVFALGAIIVEALIEYIKTLMKALEEKQYKTLGTQIASIILGIGLACLLGLDFFGMLGIVVPYPIVGMILSGLIMSRGSNYFSDFLKKVQPLFPSVELSVPGVNESTGTENKE